MYASMRRLRLSIYIHIYYIQHVSKSLILRTAVASARIPIRYILMPKSFGRICVYDAIRPQQRIYFMMMPDSIESSTRVYKAYTAHPTHTHAIVITFQCCTRYLSYTLFIAAKQLHR